MPIFERLGNAVYQGPPGRGQHAKLANQIAIAGTMLGVCEALAYAKRVGLDGERLLQSISRGAAGSALLVNAGPRMLAGDFAPGFYVKHFIKDMDLALTQARAFGLDAPGLSLSRSLLRRARGERARERWALSRFFDCTIANISSRCGAKFSSG